MASGGSEWQVRYSKSHGNRPYYYNEATGVTQWEPPAGMAVETPPSSHASPTKRKVHVYHLLVKHSKSRRPSSWRTENISLTDAEALDEIRALRAAIYADPDGVFEGLKKRARERSDCSSAKRDGDLGFFGAGEMQSTRTACFPRFISLESFEDAAFALKVGDLSGPVKSDSGIHLIYRVA